MPLPLLFLLCLLSLTNLSACLDSGSKVNVNRKPETPSRKYFAPSDHVISGLGLPKQNVVVSLPKTAEPAERNEPGLKVTASSSVGEEEADSFPGKRRIQKTERVLEKQNIKEGSAGSIPLLTEGSKVATILNDVVENLASLRDIVNNLKYQSHVMYRQLKKMQAKSCSINCHHRMTDLHQHLHLSPQQDGRFSWGDEHLPNAPGPVSAALRSDEDAGTEAGVSLGRDAVAAADGDLCPAQFSYSRETDRCYRLSGDRLTWKMARERCRWMKASLASVDSAREQRVINDMARSNPATHHCDFWIGLTRQGPMSAKDWYWDGDGHLLSYSNWNDHEPNNGNGEEHCTQMLWVFNWKWNDAPCSHGNACFVCESRPKVTVVQ